MLEFEWPWLFLLLPLPILVRLLVKPAGVEQAALRVPFLHDFDEPGSSASHHIVNHRIWLFLALLAWVALLAAAARPQWLGEPVELPIKGRDIMLAVDLSGSMKEKDFILNNRRVSRLAATKAVATKFIRQRSGDRIGLILFGTRAYQQAPLTFDRKTVITLLNEALINIAGQATAIGDAIGLAVKRLREKEGDRILILLSDGENTAGEVGPLKAADLAAAEGLKVYTIGIGPDARSASNFFGMSIRGPRSSVDEKTLTAVAQKTGGRYFHASNTRELAEIYQVIDRLEPIESETRIYRPIDALFYWPLGIAILISLLIILGRLINRMNG